MKKRWAAAIAAVCVVATSVAHRPILRLAGQTLIVDEHLDRADVVVIAADAFFVGADDGAKLVADHVSNRVAVFTVIPDPEIYRIHHHDPTAQTIRRLRRLGVPRVDQIPTAVNGTTDSVSVLVNWCRANDVHSVLVITNADHSRRVRRVLDRVLAGTTGLTAAVHVSSESAFRADDWWTHHGTLLTFARELPKLVVDAASHPNL